MRFFIAAIFIVFPAAVFADLSVPHFFSDHMLLQRGTEAAIWGKADANAEVTASFKGSTASAKADDKGNWKIEIPTGEADAEGAELEITSGDDSHAISDVLVGEVWFASGQSNMYFPMSRVEAYEEMISKSALPGIRVFNAPRVTAVEPQNDIEGEWTLAGPDTIPGYSAVAFFFVKKLHEELGVPVGLIVSAWGGKPVETFTSREALKTLPGTEALVEATMESDADYDAEKAKAAFETKLEQWKTAVADAKGKSVEERRKLPRKPTLPKRPLDTEGKPGVLFNSMIHPFTGYTMRGAIWYQGEGNAKSGAVPYDQTLPLMIRDWRERWNDDFSFYFVQLANFREPTTEPGNNDPWPLLQDRMRRILETTPKTGMAIINDVGEAKDIHPKNKHDVGERLALWALAKDYGKNIVYSGPIFESSEIEDGKAVITFAHVGDGLRIRDGGELKRFEIAGKDKVWHWADAEIAGENTVIVSSAEVAEPAAVRYAWAANPEGANLVNSEGLPASVFRTDDWDDVVVKVDDSAAKELEARRELAAEIKALSAKRNAVERGSDEYKAVTAKRAELLEKFRATAPKK